MSAVHCPECGFANPEGANYCQKCGAYLGGPDEILRAGRLPEVAADIDATRAAARARKGWIMDTYLLRRRDP